MSSPRQQYRREYWVYPKHAAVQQRKDLYLLAAKAQVTCGPSYDDAGIGALADKTAVLFGLPSVDHQTYRDWYAEFYPGTRVEFRLLPGTSLPPSPPKPTPTGKAKMGLHASAYGGDFPDGDFGEFFELQPDIIKVMSNHTSNSVHRLATQHPHASWVLRAYESFQDLVWRGPDLFFERTYHDVARLLNILNAYSGDVVIELHNEPNLISEGLGSSWMNSRIFNDWYQAVLAKYRAAFPGARFIFPGLSPGHDITDIRQAHITFARSCRPSIEKSDGLGVHTYWATGGMAKAISVVDWYLSEFPGIPIWITEASNNKPASPHTKATDYVNFWDHMRERPRVQGVTYFVASGGAYPDEFWTGNDIARKVRAGMPS